MIDMYLNYDNMHKNEMFYALICINNHVIEGISYMLSIGSTCNAIVSPQKSIKNLRPF